MNPDTLLFVARILSILVIVLVVLQFIWSHYRLRRDRRRVIASRLNVNAEVLSESSEKVVIGHLERILLRAGIHWSRLQLAIIAAAIALFLVLIALLNGLLASLITMFAVSLALWLYWRTRLQQQRRKIYDDLPGIIDSALRYITAGRSLENALVEAFKDTPPVFDPLAFRLRSAVESGRDYAGLFEDFSVLHKVPSLVSIAIALRTSAHFGSSVRPVLRQVAEALRSQQELRREFLAATSEIRFTAAIFALLPIGLAGYLILANKNYSHILLDTVTGHKMLGLSGLLIVIGVVIMMRMIQGVGRG